MRPIPQEVIDIGWNELSPRLGGGESRVFELLREIYEGEDLEERETALDTGYQWFDTLSTPAAQWIKSLLPLLSDEREPLLPSVLMYLSLYADRSFPARGASEEEIETALTVIRGGYDRYLKLFRIAPLWDQGLLTSCPDHAAEYLPLLFSLYDSQSDPAIRAGIVLTLAKVGEKIPDWRIRLIDGIREGSDSAVAFVCASEIVVLDGDDASPEILATLVRTSSGDAASKLFRRCMLRVLPRLSRQRQVAMLIGILREAKYSADCLSTAKFLLEAAYGQIGVVSDSPDMIMEANSSSVRTQYTWIGPPRTHDLQLPGRNEAEDWLGAIANKEALGREINPYRPPSEAEPTNLYELFGLPRDHKGLVILRNTNLRTRAL